MGQVAMQFLICILRGKKKKKITTRYSGSLHLYKEPRKKSGYPSDVMYIWYSLVMKATCSGFNPVKVNIPICLMM